MKKLWLAWVLLLCGCAVAPPAGVTPVTGFELERYLGKWY
jgi:apolipoprotein D and lipocalin family protein